MNQQLAHQLDPYLKRFRLPADNSHKGQNGKLLIIGGSELFHAASKWSLDTAAQFVDMVFYASVPSTNALVQKAKGEFWNGIVIPRTEIENYISEADAILIGPGMERQTQLPERMQADFTRELTDSEWDDTDLVTHHLLLKYPEKQWILDAGALQMLRPEFLPQHAILTPHHGELARLLDQLSARNGRETLELLSSDSELRTIAAQLHNATLLIKGEVDVVATDQTVERISGGNAGMTKGGTGDVLAGLVAALACTQEPVVAAVLGSVTNKLAGEQLLSTQGVFFGASQLVATVPAVLWRLLEGRQQAS